jgi:hypothetical protein
MVIEVVNEVQEDDEDKCRNCGGELGNIKRSWRICNKCWVEYHKFYRFKRASKKILELGGKCSKCGFSDERALKVVNNTIVCWNCYKISKVEARGAV